MLFPQWEDSLFSNINSEQAPADKEEEDEYLQIFHPMKFRLLIAATKNTIKSFNCIII